MAGTTGGGSGLAPHRPRIESWPGRSSTSPLARTPMPGCAPVADVRPTIPALGHRPALAAPSPLRGRDAELELVGELVAGLAAGAGGALVVEGPEGIGRTRLLAEAATIAARNGVRVATGATSPATAPVPLGPLLAALFEGDAPLFGRDVLHALSRRPDRRYWLVQELRGLLDAAARDAPLLVVLDDLHRADAETLAALRTIVAGLAGAPVAWMLAARDGEAPPELHAAVDQLLGDGGRHVALRPLSPVAVAQVVDDALGGAPAGPLLALAAKADGNPALLVALLRGLREDGLVRHAAGRVELTAERLPARLGDASRRRLGRLDAATAELLRVASVLGRFSIGHLAAMLDVTPAALLVPLDEALGADVLADDGRQLAFRHELLREALIATLPSSMRRGLHRQAADVLLAAGADPLTVAAHMAAGAA